MRQVARFSRTVGELCGGWQWRERYKCRTSEPPHPHTPKVSASIEAGLEGCAGREGTLSGNTQKWDKVLVHAAH